MEWGEIDLQRGLINVSASKSKTAKRRLIQIAPNLADWLRPYAGRSGKIFAYSHRWYQLNVDLLRKAIGLAEWPNNGLRHSFATYYLARHRDAPKLALEMGHTTPRMIFDNYREVVTPDEANRYWSVRPPTRMLVQVYEPVRRKFSVPDRRLQRSMAEERLHRADVHAFIDEAVPACVPQRVRMHVQFCKPSGLGNPTNHFPNRGSMNLLAPLTDEEEVVLRRNRLSNR